MSKSFFYLTFFFPAYCLSACLALCGIGQAMAAETKALPGPIPLGAVATVDFEDENGGDGKGGWTDQGKENSLTGFPRGSISLCGIPFEIPTKGLGVLAFHSPQRPDLPQQVKLRPVGRRGHFLCVLAGYGWSTPPGSVGRITVVYADGSEEVISLDYPQTVSAWWTPRRMEKTVLAWKGKNQLGVDIGLQLATFPLSQPEQEIRSITIAAVPQHGQLMIVGLTLVDVVPAEAVPLPLWEPETTDTSSWFPVSPATDRGSLPVWGLPSRSATEKERLMTLVLAPSLNTPDKKSAEKIRRLVQLLGYNAVEFAPLEEVVLSSPDGRHSLLDPGKARALRDLQDLLYADGIGTVATLGGRRLYECDDGVEFYRDIPRDNPVPLFFDSAGEQLLKATVRDYFSTPGKSAPDYAVILFEGSLFHFTDDRLPPAQLRMRQEAWIQWLRAKYPTQASLAAAWLVEGEPSPLKMGESLEKGSIRLMIFSDILKCRKRDLNRACDQLHFLYDAQQDWFQRVAVDLREAGAKTPLCGTVFNTRALVRDLQIRLMAGLDLVGEFTQSHGVSAPPGDLSTIFLNPDPLQPVDGDFFDAAYSRVEGKPFVVTDDARGWPHDTSFLHVFGNTVVGALQGWDGITHRGLTQLDSPASMRVVDGTVQQTPSVLALLPLSRNIFIRKDLDTAPILIRRLLQRPGDPLPTDSITMTESLLARQMPEGAVIAGGVSAILDGATEINSAELTKLIQPDRVLSATGQVEWNKAASRLSVLTPKSLAIAGKLADSTASTTSTLTGTQGMGILYATSLDGQPLETSKKILVGAIGRSRNKGAQMEQSTFSAPNDPLQYRLIETEEPGILMEPVTGVLELKTSLKGSWKLSPLNLFGQKVGKEELDIASSKGVATIPVDNRKWKTPLMLLSHD
jgi:hypothetical protein